MVEDSYNADPMPLISHGDGSDCNICSCVAAQECKIVTGGVNVVAVT